MRLLALTLLVGCSFQPGAFGTGDGQPGGDDDAPGSGSDGSGQCTAHDLPPSVNVDATQWSADFLSAPMWACDGTGTTTINSTSGVASSTNCELGTVPMTNDVAQTTGGGSVLVVRLRGLSLTNGHVLRLVGDKPIVLLVAGDVVVDSGALVDAGAVASMPGAGGSRSGECTDLSSGLGGAPSGNTWGAGGGGFGTPGGQGCYDIVNGGSATGNATLEPLRGGCSGGISNGSTSGAGGGALEISASGTISIGATAVANISAAGGGAPGAPSGGGNGGGSGGAILLVASAMPTIGTNSGLRAHGGAGSEGCNSSCGGGNDSGGDGHATNDSRATDASGVAGGGNNQDQGRRGGLASIVGTGALMTGVGEMATKQTGGRGGGGGGGGRIVVRTGTVTPACD